MELFDMTIVSVNDSYPQIARQVPLKLSPRYFRTLVFAWVCRLLSCSDVIGLSDLYLYYHSRYTEYLDLSTASGSSQSPEVSGLILDDIYSMMIWRHSEQRI